MPNNLRIYIEKSDIDQPTLNKQVSARGLNFESALKSAQRTYYQFEQKDSVLLFDWAAHIEKDELWRAQEVRLTLRIPKNTQLVIDNKFDRYLQNHNIWFCIPKGSPYENPTKWIMTDEGLKCKTDSLQF